MRRRQRLGAPGILLEPAGVGVDVRCQPKRPLVANHQLGERLPQPVEHRTQPVGSDLLVDLRPQVLDDLRR